MLYKVTVRSVIDYGMPIYFNNLKQTEIAKISKIQYRAAKLVTGALHLTSQVKLEEELGWETIQNRANYLGVTLFHKIHLKETRPLIGRLMPPLTDALEYDLRNKNPYVNFPFHTIAFSKSFFPYFTKYWNKLPSSVRCKNLFEFKQEISFILKPKKYKHYKTGSKLGNSLLTRLRVGRSTLPSHLFSIGLTDSPQCSCGYKDCTTTHLFWTVL